MTHLSDMPCEGSVLVVDDHPQARESIADVLRCGGFQVACAASAADSTTATPEASARSVSVMITRLAVLRSIALRSLVLIA